MDSRDTEDRGLRKARARTGFPTRTLGNDKSGDRGRKKARTKTGSPTKTLGDDGIKARLKAYLYLPIN
jgi:hypothetical protein